jgi:hypothetical protein
VVKVKTKKKNEPEPTKPPASESKSGTRRRRRPSEESAAWQFALEEAYDDGFELPPRPDNNGTTPQLPSDLTDLDDKLLMDLMTELTRWLEYQGSRLSRAEVLERELDFLISQRAAILLSSTWGGGREDRVAIHKAEAENDEQIKELRGNRMQAHAYRKLVDSLYDATERKIATVSRELTRRTNMEPAQRRVHRGGAG